MGLPKEIIDFVNTASGPTVAIVFLLIAIIGHMRGVWVWKSDCNRLISDRDAIIKQLQIDAAANQRRLEEEKDELLQLAINGTSQAVALARVVAAIKGSSPP